SVCIPYSLHTLFLEGGEGVRLVSTPAAVPQDEMEATTISPSEVRGVVDGEDPCFLAKDSGVKCTSYSLLWYYRVDTGSCDRFWYGGCGGNANRFNSEQDCSWARIAVDSGKPVCLEDSDAGSCYSFVLKWFFNKTQPARCTPFWYGGCEGNRNRFETRELCESICLPLEAPGVSCHAVRLSCCPSSATELPATLMHRAHVTWKLWLLICNELNLPPHTPAPGCSQTVCIVFCLLSLGLPSDLLLAHLLPM
uniref:BPTI/Kunitz inhibitor domain-containing protein n=1 Tax=Chelydra serpentina TaxID=8475 RepID=A0A8C3RTT8_CHESE